MTEEAQLDTNQALLFMEAWGSGDTLVSEPFDGRYRYAISDYAPEFVNEELPERVRDHFGGVVTVLCIDEPKVPGYTVAYRYQAGERECPGLEFEDHHADNDGNHQDCSFCEGNDYIYWGEEWQVFVLVPDEEEEEDEDENDDSDEDD